MIIGGKSKWRSVSRRVPQGSVLATIMFLMCLKDILVGIISYISLFEDDAKLLRITRSNEDCKGLQNDLNEKYESSTSWDMEFSAKACYILRTRNGTMQRK